MRNHFIFLPPFFKILATPLEVILQVLVIVLSLTILFISRYDEEQALADAREKEVKSRAGQRGKGKDVKKQATWK